MFVEIEEHGIDVYMMCMHDCLYVHRKQEIQLYVM
jgi:hypothetical protein